jgi:hypothetical protein
MSVAFAGAIGVMALMVAGFVVALVMAAHRERDRLDALALWTHAEGWSPPVDDDRWADAFTGAPFGQGDDRQARDVCTRSVAGRRQVAFSYRYTTYETVTRTDADGATHTERRRTDHPYRVVAVELPAPLGPLQIVREGPGQRLLTALGAQDVEIELADFNERYRVTARDEKHAVDLLNPRTVARLMTYPDATLRLQDGWALSWDVGALEPAFVDERLRLLQDVVAGVPRFVWLDRGIDPGVTPPPGTEQPLQTSDDR